MSPFFDELEGQLRSAAQDVVGGQAVRRPRRPRRWLPAGLDLAPVLASVVVVLVVGAALVLLGRGGGHQPSPPASPPPDTGLAALIGHTPQKRLRQEFAYIEAATKSVVAAKACQVQQPTGVSFVHRTPDRQLLSLLGVLRRPATPADRVDTQLLEGTPDVYAGSIRRASKVNGESYYVVVAGVDRAASMPSDRCFALQEQALARYLPKIPQALRAPTTELQTGYIAWAHDTYAHAPRDSICFVDAGASDNGSNCGITAAEIKYGMAPQNDQGVFSGIVPDGVATVTLTWPAAQGRPRRSATAPVIGNVYAIHVAGVPEPTANNSNQPVVTWHSRQGRVLKTIPVPTPAMKRAGCQMELVACTLVKDGGLTATSSSSSSSPVARRAQRAPARH